MLKIAQELAAARQVTNHDCKCRQGISEESWRALVTNVSLHQDTGVQEFFGGTRVVWEASLEYKDFTTRIAHSLGDVTWKSKKRVTMMAD